MTTTADPRLHAIAPALSGAGLALSLLISLAAVADDDKEPIPKVGHCPAGYRTSGNYCLPIKSDDKEVIIKLESCPRGYRTSGKYCVELK